MVDSGVGMSVEGVGASNKESVAINGGGGVCAGDPPAHSLPYSILFLINIGGEIVFLEGKEKSD